MKTRVWNLATLVLFLMLSLGFVSCNKEDFYKKDELQNPFQDPNTTGTVDNGGQNGSSTATAGSTQGGVDGTQGTTGSSTGGTTGGVDGSTTSGSTTGTVDGSTDGGVDGSTTSGSTTGTTVGGVDGTTTSGTTTGSTVGGVDGSTTSGSTTGGTTGTTTPDCGPNVSNRDARCVEETFSQNAAQTKKLDIVWVIDNSGSMQDEQDSLGTNFDAFINNFITKDVDFKMAVTTTDASTPAKKGEMVFGSSTLLTSAKARENENKFKDDFKNLVRVGTSGSGNERGLEGAEGFMTKYASTFLRPDAYLAVVILSDEEDQSANSVDYYTDLLKSNKSSDGLVKVYSIVDVTMSNVGGQGVSTGYLRYHAASSNTAGSTLDIRDNFAASLASMGDSIINLLDSFAMGNDIVTGSLKVYVNGVESTDYTYDSASRSIKFDNAHIPAVGSEIKVYYLKQ